MRVPSAVGEEIVQEVALRMLTSRVEGSTAADLWPWASTVARHLAVDHWRAEARTVLGDPPDVVCRDSVEETVESRLRFESTIAALGTLSASDQQHLIRVMHELTAVGPLPSRIKVAVHRARRRLVVAVGETGALIGAWRLSGNLRRTPVVATLAVAFVIPTAYLVTERPPATVERLQRESTPGSSGHPIPVPVVAVSHLAHIDVSTPSFPPANVVSATPATVLVIGRTSPSATTIPIRYPAYLPPGQVAVRAKHADDHFVCLRRLPLLTQACVR